MPQRSRVLSLTARTMLLCCVIGGWQLPALSAQAPAGARGNVPGEWRVWGADLWSTRYSPLDQIHAANFNSLKLAWQWNAGAFGSDEYYRTTTCTPTALSPWPHRLVATGSIPHPARRCGCGALTGAPWQKAPPVCRERAGLWNDGRGARHRGDADTNRR